jgi:hypothetical protein
VLFLLLLLLFLFLILFLILIALLTFSLFPCASELGSPADVHAVLEQRVVGEEAVQEGQ